MVSWLVPDAPRRSRNGFSGWCAIRLRERDADTADTGLRHQNRSAVLLPGDHDHRLPRGAAESATGDFEYIHL